LPRKLQELLRWAQLQPHSLAFEGLSLNGGSGIQLGQYPDGCAEEDRMSANAPEEMMRLLEELVLLKRLDAADGGSVVQSVESQERQKRRDEIGDQIKALGETAG